MPDPRHRPTRPARGVLGAGGLGLVVVLVWLAGTALTAAPASATSRCPASVAADQVRVVIVVDPGTEADSPGGVSVECFVMASGSTGADLLRERASSLGAAKPRYNASGLLCAIDGFPASGCGQQSGSLYRYWSYWSGASGSWDYGTGNPFARRLRDGDIEGWRFQAGHANPGDAPPRVAPDPAGFFPLPPPPSPGDGSGPGGGAASGGGPSGATAGPRGQVDGRSTGSPDAVTDDSTATTADGQGDAVVDDEAAQEPTPEDDRSSSAQRTDGTSDAASNDELAARPAGASSGLPLGVLAGAGAIVVLVVAAIVQFRRGASR